MHNSELRSVPCSYLNESNWDVSSELTRYTHPVVPVRHIFSSARPAVDFVPVTCAPCPRECREDRTRETRLLKRWGGLHGLAWGSNSGKLSVLSPCMSKEFCLASDRKSLRPKWGLDDNSQPSIPIEKEPIQQQSCRPKSCECGRQDHTGG